MIRKKLLIYAQSPPEEIQSVLRPLMQAAKRDFTYEGLSGQAMNSFFKSMVSAENQHKGMLEISSENFHAIYYFRDSNDTLLPIPGLQDAPEDISTPFCMWKGIPLYVCPSIPVFVRYFQRKNVSKGMKAQRKRYLKAMFDLIQEIRGTSVREVPTKAKWCYTVDDVKQLVNEARATGICAVDTETMPKTPGVDPSEWLKHNTSFWLAKTRILLFSPRVGEGWIVPSFDPISWFNVGMEDEFRVLVGRPGQTGPPRLDTQDPSGIILDSSEDLRDIPEKYNLVGYMNGERMNDYQGEAILLERAQACALFDNVSYAKVNRVSDLFQDVVGPLLRDGIIQDTSTMKVVQNYAFDRNIIKYPGAGLGWEFRGPVEDTLLMMHADSKEFPNGLKPNAERYWSEFLGWGDEIDYVTGSLGDLGEYGAPDTDATLRLYQLNFLKLMRKPKVYYFYRNALLGSMEWFADLEYEGDVVDTDKLEEARQAILAELSSLEFQMRNTPQFKRYVSDLNRDMQAQNIEILDIKLRSKVNATEDKIMQKLRQLSAQGKEESKSFRTWMGKLEWIRSEEKDPDSPFSYKFVSTIREQQASIASGDVEYYRVWDPKGRRDVVANKATKKVASAAEFNFDSGDQISHFIYESKHGLGFPKKMMKRSRKDPVTGRKRLVKELVGPTTTDDLYWIEKKDKSGFIKTLMIYKVIKYYLTKIEEVRDVMDPDGRVHSSYRFVSTDRTASSNPNMQNVPQRSFIEEARPFLTLLLESFAAPEGWIRGKCDLAQAEIRVFAELYGIDKIAELISNNEDLHTTAARVCMGISDSEWEAMDKSEKKFKRTFGKILNFGLLYGASVSSLIEYARNEFKIVIEKARGEEMRRMFFEVLYSEIPGAHQKQRDRVRKQGYCETLFGSRRELSDLFCGDRYYVAAAERQGINMPVQGTAGIYMYWVAAVFNLRRIVKGYRGRLMNIIHDDLPSFVPPEELKDFALDLMETAADPVLQPYFGFTFDKVPMASDYEYGTNWSNQVNTLEL